jgi:membrane-associated phospholipid phosphatase
VSIDFSVSLFLNSIVNQSNWLNQLLIFTQNEYNGVLIVTLIAVLWCRLKVDRARMVTDMGSVIAAGIASRIMQLKLSFHARPLYEPALHLRWHTDILQGTLSHWSSFPSDHATLLAGMATLIWTRDRRLGSVAALVTLVMGAARIALGLHYLSDTLVGYGLGILFVLVAHRIRIPKILHRLPYESPWFAGIAFMAAFQFSTFFFTAQNLLKLLLPIIPK